MQGSLAVQWSEPFTRTRRSYDMNKKLMSVVLASILGAPIAWVLADDMGKDKMDLAKDLKDVRQDRRDIAKDQRDIHQDKTDIRKDAKDVNADRKEMRADRRDLRKDRHHRKLTKTS